MIGIEFLHHHSSMPLQLHTTTVASDDLSSKMSITDLLNAAEYLEKAEREKERKRPLPILYAAPVINEQNSDALAIAMVQSIKRRRTATASALILPRPDDIPLVKIQQSPQLQTVAVVDANAASANANSRATHNELEKNRRAHLRTCLDSLKLLLPINVEANRNTTLSLLTKARQHVKFLEDQRCKEAAEKAELLRRQRHLKELLKQNGLAATALGAHRCASTATLQPCAPPLQTLTRPSSLPEHLGLLSPISPTNQRSRTSSECSAASTMSAIDSAERESDMDSSTSAGSSRRNSEQSNMTSSSSNCASVPAPPPLIMSSAMTSSLYPSAATTTLSLGGARIDPLGLQPLTLDQSASAMPPPMLGGGEAAVIDALVGAIVRMRQQNQTATPLLVAENAGQQNLQNFLAQYAALASYNWPKLQQQNNNYCNEAEKTAVTFFS